MCCHVSIRPSEIQVVVVLTEERVVSNGKWLRQGIPGVSSNGRGVHALNVLRDDAAKTHVLEQKKIKVIGIHFLHGVEWAFG